MFREPPARRDRMRVHVSAAEEAAGDAPMAVSSTPRGADIPRLTIDRDGHRQVAFHCSTAGIFIMACPPRNTRQQSPACHHRAIPQPVAACARCTAIPRPAGPPRPGRPWGAADRVHASLPNTRLPSPPGYSAGRRSAFRSRRCRMDVRRVGDQGGARDGVSPVEDAPRRPRQSGKRLPTAPLGVGVHAHGLIAVAAQCLIALAAAIEPGAPRSISMLTNLGDGAPDLASLA